MDFPLEWNVFPLAKNQKAPPILKEWETTRYSRDQLKDHIGNFALGCGDISGGIVVFDWDFRNGLKQEGFEYIYKEYYKWNPRLATTLIADTPHGYHFYYIRRGDQYRNTSKKNIGYSDTLKTFESSNSTKYAKYLKGFDTRANGGYVVIPPSKIGTNKYVWFKLKPIIEITEQEYDAIFEFFIEKDIAGHTIRSGFVDILEGKLDVHELRQKKKLGNNEEQVIWKELYHELYACTELEPEYFFEGLVKNQKSFDLEKTQPQLKNRKNIDYIRNGRRLSKEKYELYFERDVSNKGMMMGSEVPTIDLKNGSLLEFITGSFYKNPKYAELTKTGINSYVINMKKGRRENETPLWIWEDFKINRVLIDNSTNEYVEKFDFNYNGKRYCEKSLLEMKEKIALKSCISSQYKQIFGVIVQKYVTELEVPFVEYRKVCGFTENGWVFPPKYYISFNKGIHQKFKKTMEEMIQLEIPTSFEKDFKDLYESITVEKRDLIFAFGIVSPFFYALKEYTDLSPFLALQSVRHTTGKSSMARLISKNFWNNYDLLTSQQLNSESRARDYFSSSTLPIVVDESKKLKDNIIDILKNMATSEGNAEYKNIDQTLGMDKPLCTPPIYTFNTPPEFFNDTAYLSRGIIFNISKRMSPEDKKKFDLCMSKFKDGIIGRYIIEKTKDLTLDHLIDLYNAQPYPINLETRQGTIYRLIYLGKTLFKKIFDIDLNLEDLEKLIDESSHFGSDSIFTIVSIQLEEATPKAREWRNEEGKKEIAWEFRPRYNWIRSEIKTHRRRGGEEGYIYNADNLQDLNNRLRLNISGVPELAEILSKRWTVREYKTWSVQGEGVKGIFIPEDHELFTEDEVSEEYGRPPEEHSKINKKNLINTLKDIMKEDKNE